MLLRTIESGLYLWLPKKEISEYSKMKYEEDDYNIVERKDSEYFLVLLIILAVVCIIAIAMLLGEIIYKISYDSGVVSKFSFLRSLD